MYFKDEGNTEPSLEEEFNTISDELFKKLERILDSERSTGDSSHSVGTVTSISSRHIPKKGERKHTPTKEEGRLTPKKEKSQTTPKKADSRPSSKKEEGRLTPKKEASRQTPKKVEKVKEKSRQGKGEIKVNSLLATSSAPDGPSVDSSAPTKLTQSAPAKAKRKIKETTEKKSKLSAPSQQVTNKNWENILMPGGDQNTGKTKPAGLTDNANEILSGQENIKAEKQDKIPPHVCENSQGDTKQDDIIFDSESDKNSSSNFSSVNKVDTSDDESMQNRSKKVRFEEFLNEDSSRTDAYPAITSEEDSIAKQQITKDENDLSSNYCTPSHTPRTSPKVGQVVNQKSNSNFAEQVNRIIKRVEDIYSQLDDMQNTVRIPTTTTV